MASLAIGSSSSHCATCMANGKISSANPSETGHYTILGYGDTNGQPGCGEKWTEAYSVYFYTDRDIVALLKERFPHLEGVIVDKYGSGSNAI